MQREIKFRVRDRETNKIVLEDASIYMIAGYIESSRSLSLRFEQWTGFHDKNGKKIYERDLLKDYGEVLFVEAVAAFKVNPSSENRDISFMEAFANIDDPEIENVEKESVESQMDDDSDNVQRDNGNIPPGYDSEGEPRGY